MTNKHMKKYSALLLIMEMQIKTTMQYHLSPARMTITKKSENSGCWCGCGEQGTLTLLVGMQTSTTTMENSVEIS